jgi:hypothetical protein
VQRASSASPKAPHGANRRRAETEFFNKIGGERPLAERRELGTNRTVTTPDFYRLLPATLLAAALVAQRYLHAAATPLQNVAQMPALTAT